MDDHFDKDPDGGAGDVQRDLLSYFGERQSHGAPPVDDPWPDDLALAQRSAGRAATAADLDLKRRAAGLRLVQPLADLDRALSAVAHEHGRELDGHRVGLTLIRDIALQNTFDEGPTNRELRSMVAGAVFEQWPDVAPPVLSHLVNLTLQVLENQKSKDLDKMFEANVYNPANRTMEKLRFRYLSYTRSQGSEKGGRGGDEYRYRVSDEATLVYGALADHDLDRDLQGALHKLVEEAIRHGQMDKAERISREASGLARRIYLRIRTLVSDLLTNARSVSWRSDLQEPVEEARVHLETRISEHDRLRGIVHERRAEDLDAETIERLVRFMEDLDKERTAINLLLRELNSAHQRFMDAQAAAFKFRRHAHIPDPRDVALSLLSLPVDALAAGIPDMLRTAAPIDAGRFFDIDRLLVSLREQAERETEPDRSVQVASEQIMPEPGVTPEESAEAQRIVAQTMAEQRDLALEDIYARIDALASNDIVRLVAGTLVYSLYGMGAQRARRDVLVDGTFENDLIKGKRLVFPRREP